MVEPPYGIFIDQQPQKVRNLVSPSTHPGRGELQASPLATVGFQPSSPPSKAAGQSLQLHHGNTMPAIDQHPVF